MGAILAHRGSLGRPPARIGRIAKGSQEKGMFKEPDRRRIYLMRHGEAAYLREDGTVVDDTRVVPLTPFGRDQAHRQAELLAGVEFDRAVCSGLPRTRETAGIVLRGRDGPTLEIVEPLEEIQGGDRHEPEDLGAWIQHIANPWADAAKPGARFIGGELFSDFSDRVIPAFQALVAQQDWRCLLLVLHGGVNRLLLNHVMNLPLGGTLTVEQDTCCINIIDLDMEDGAVVRYLVRAINITGYNLSKAGIHLTDMERAAKRMAAQISSRPE
ncbi:MAG: histidine phosphatase family protein [Gammaproteobacteria bacterium]|nr:MAG: histidine phosphatase family protein [Gammaproteobacteria bacterium]